MAGSNRVAAECSSRVLILRTESGVSSPRGGENRACGEVRLSGNV